MIQKFSLSLLFIIYTGTLFSQIVNIEDRRKILTDTTGIFGSADAGFSLNDNGRRVLNLTANITAELIDGDQRWLALTHYSVVRAGEESFVNQGFQHLRYNKRLRKRLTWEAFGQVQYNERLSITFRGLLGTGPRFRLSKKKADRLFLGTLYMYQYEELRDVGIIHRDHRLSLYLSYRLRFAENINLTGTTYYQPLLTDFSVTRLSSQTAMQFDFTKNLSFKTTFNISLDNRLSEEVGVPVATYSLVTGIKWIF